jgi:hypothetical protein
MPHQQPSSPPLIASLQFSSCSTVRTFFMLHSITSSASALRSRWWRRVAATLSAWRWLMPICRLRAGGRTYCISSLRLLDYAGTLPKLDVVVGVHPARFVIRAASNRDIDRPRQFLNVARRLVSSANGAAYRVGHRARPDLNRSHCS